MYSRLEELLKGAPAWLSPELVIAAVGLLAAMIVLWLILRLVRTRAEAPRLDPAQREQALPTVHAVTPPVAHDPMLDEPPLAPPAPPLFVPEPEPIIAREPEPIAPEPVAAEPVAPEPEAPPAIADTALTDASPLADEPIAAAAPFDASPASIASEFSAPPEVAPEPEPLPVPAEPAPAPEPAAPSAGTGTDDLTRMKGIGPRLVQRLNALGISSFAQIAALTAADAEALDAQLGDFQGRMGRDRWIEQAALLAAGDTAGYEEKFGKL